MCEPKTSRTFLCCEKVGNVSQNEEEEEDEVLIANRIDAKIDPKREKNQTDLGQIQKKVILQHCIVAQLLRKIVKSNKHIPDLQYVYIDTITHCTFEPNC